MDRIIACLIDPENLFPDVCMSLALAIVLSLAL